MQHADGKLLKKFLLELSKTLDIGGSMRASGIDAAKARAIFKDLASRIAVQEELFAPLAVSGPYEIRVDGASRGNPGQAGAGALIKDPDGNTVRELKKYLGIMTNNMAEYSALIMALTEARKMGVSDVEVFADSELMVKQLTGKYKVKSADLKPLFDDAYALLKGFRKSKIVHVYREENGVADRLANEAIDKRAG